MQQYRTYTGVPQISTCPLGYFRDHPAMESDSFTLHQHWTKGILPHKGGIKDQPAIFSVVVFSVEAGINAAKVTQQEIAEAQAELQGRIRNKGH